MTSVDCARCGASTPRASAHCSLLRLVSTPTNPTGAVLVAEAPDWSLFCSPACLAGGVASDRARGQCSVCGKTWQRKPGEAGGGRPGPGRPAAYCGAACRRAHERNIAKALKELARDVVPGTLAKVEAALGLSLTLARHWQTDSGPPALRPPSPRARVALRDRVERLTERREALLAEQEAGKQTAAHIARREEAARRQALEDAAEKAWRKSALENAADAGS